MLCDRKWSGDRGRMISLPYLWIAREKRCKYLHSKKPWPSTFAQTPGVSRLLQSTERVQRVIMLTVNVLNVDLMRRPELRSWADWNLTLSVVMHTFFLSSLGVDRGSSVGCGDCLSQVLCGKLNARDYLERACVYVCVCSTAITLPPVPTQLRDHTLVHKQRVGVYLLSSSR